jgi:hypothetical protein
VVWPASAPVPNRSNSNLKLSGEPPSPVGIVPFDAEATLLDADARLPVAAELLVDADLRGAERVVPVGVEPAVDVLDEIGLRESVNFEG